MAMNEIDQLFRESLFKLSKQYATDIEQLRNQVLSLSNQIVYLQEQLANSQKISQERMTTLSGQLDLLMQLLTRPG